MEGEIGNEKENRLERLKRLLYARQRGLKPLRRSGLESRTNETPTAWRHVEPLKLASSLPSTKLLKRILWWTAGFFLLAAAVALFVFYRGNNLILASNVVLKVTGPLEIAAGQELSLQVEVENKNNAALELADLIVEYPSGTRQAGAVDKALARERLPLGTIAPGQSARKLVRAVLFGEKGARVPIKLTVEYRLAQSSAIFDKTENYEVTIGSTPLLLSLNVPAEVNSNQEILLEVEAQSNAESVITNPVLIMSYPAGFRFIQATPVPTRGQNIWSLPSLKPGARARVQIRGTLEGQDDEQESFRAAAGTIETDTALELAATYGSAFETVTIKRPFVGLDVALNQSTASEYIADSREPVRVDIGWVNNLPGEITAGEIQATLAGRPLDPTSVSAPKGFYNSTQNTILWNQTSDSKLAQISAGDAGQISFTFASLSLVSAEGAALRQPVLDLVVKFKGKHLDDNGKAVPVYSEVKRKIKFSSAVQLAAKTLQRTGAFTNHGPLPPKVGAETSYTIVWSVLNSANSLDAAQVSATLPPYVRWLGATKPSSETVKFSGAESSGGEVVWQLGQVAPGTGTAGPAREVSFQVALTPSVSQVGSAPVLVSEATLSAFDTFTKATLTAKLKRALDTVLVNEAGFQLGEDRVVK